MSIHLNTYFVCSPVRTIQFSPRQRLGSMVKYLANALQGQFKFKLPLQGELSVLN